MKKLLIFILASAAITASAQNEAKPRYLKHATPLCPIDMSKWGSKEGLIKGNSQSLEIDTVPIIIEAKSDLPDATGKIVIKKGQKIPDIRYDTVIKRSLLIEAGPAFDIIYQIGSFSIVKFWPVKNQKTTGLFTHLSNNSKGDGGVQTSLDALDGLKINGLLAVTPKKINPQKDSAVYDLSKSYYIVPTQLILSQSKEFENKNGTWNIGLLALPVKLRPFATEPGHFDFTDGFSLGTTFSWTLHHNWKTGFTHNLLLYTGLSSYTADESKIKETRNDYKIALFSPALGYMWERNGVQVSILSGVDFPAGSLQKNWVYRNKPWLGVGLGLSLFKLSNSDNTSKGENKQ